MVALEACGSEKEVFQLWSFGVSETNGTPVISSEGRIFVVRRKRTGGMMCSSLGFYVSLVCVYRTTSRIETIMPLRSADLYLWYGQLRTECLGEFTLLSPNGGDPISITTNWQDSEWG